MKSMRMLVMLFVLRTLLAPISCAQEKHKASEDPKPPTPLRVQVVLSEFEGEKKISSLPYTFFVDAEEGRLGALTSLRMGLRIPVALGTKDSSSEIQYMDVGMEVDCNAAAMEDGRFKIALAVRRSSIYPPGTGKGTLGEAPSDLPASTRPILRQFSAAVHLLVRDGQTVKSTAATDPVSGRILKTELNGDPREVGAERGETKKCIRDGQAMAKQSCLWAVKRADGVAVLRDGVLQFAVKQIAQSSWRGPRQSLHSPKVLPPLNDPPGADPPFSFFMFLSSSL